MLRRWFFGSSTPAQTAVPTKNFADSDEQSTATAGNDALADFEALLASEQAKIINLRNEWLEHETKLIGTDAELFAKDATECNKEKHAEIKSIFSTILSKLRSIFQRADTYLQGMLNTEMGEHIKELEDHIQELRKQAADDTLDLHERRRAAIHMCKAAIVMLNEMTALSENFGQEIRHRISLVQLDAKALKVLVELGLGLLGGMLGMSLEVVGFDLDFNFIPAYRNFLNNEIQVQEGEFETGIAGAEGILAQSEGVIAQLTEAPKRKSSTGLFDKPAAEVKADEVDPVPAVGFAAK